MRLAAAVIGLALGVALGLWGGYVVWPVEYAGISPEMLAAGHQTDYVLMVATALEADGDLETALERLGRLGDSADIVLLNAMPAADDNPAARAGLQQLAAALGVHATMPDPVE